VDLGLLSPASPPLLSFQRDPENSMEAVKNIAQKVTGDTPAGATDAADVSCRRHFGRPSPGNTPWFYCS